MAGFSFFLLLVGSHFEHFFFFCNKLKTIPSTIKEKKKRFQVLLFTASSLKNVQCKQPCRSHVTKPTRACPPRDGTWIYAFTTVTSRNHGPGWSFRMSVLSFAIAFIWTSKGLSTLFFLQRLEADGNDGTTRAQRCLHLTSLPPWAEKT